MSLKQQFLSLEAEENELSQRIKSIVGGIVPYDTVVRLLESTTEVNWKSDGTLSSANTASRRSESLFYCNVKGNLSRDENAGIDRRLAEAKLELASLKSRSRHVPITGERSSNLRDAGEGLRVYETERQPETLREASAFLKQLTDGKYVRVWTPLGKNALRIDNDKNQSLPLEVLSRGTREAVFIALRLSLAAAYSRRGVTLPLVLDDVLVISIRSVPNRLLKCCKTLRL